ncbi:MAG TPA: hypothetical protein VE978_13435 [Chitinophagales bacterium]|nr:hypothetical protein [Chitinophagales bacterium]
MTYHQFRERFESFHLFSLKDIRKAEPRFDRRRLVEWQQKKYIIKIANSYYTFAKQKITEPFLFLASNKIYQPSYISLESALAYYGFIPEGVFLITGVSTRKTQKFNTAIGSFVFRNIKEELFFGYQLLSAGNLHFKIAGPEKALLDYLYFNRHLDTPEEFEQTRFNRGELRKRITFRQLKILSKQFRNPRLEKQTQSLIQFIQHV